MTCPEERVLAFLSGDLTEDQARDFDDHLLTCESCWKAVQEDRAGRLALDQLRDTAPAGLADRIAMAVQLAGSVQERPSAAPGQRTERRAPGPGANPDARRRRAGASGDQSGWGNFRYGAVRGHRPAVLVAAAFVGMVLAAGAWWGTRGAGSGEPPQLAAVLATAQSMSRGQLSGRGPEIVTHDQLIAVWYYRVEDQPVLVATSDRQFPMPAHPISMPGSTPSDWMATRGRLGIYCVNEPAGQKSMLVVAAMPVAQLPHVAADLHLI